MNKKLSIDTITNRNIGFAILRLMLGINMLSRSIVRLPELSDFASGMAEGFAVIFLPESFVFVYAFIIVFTESIIGVMLILGWKTRWGLTIMGLLLCTLAFGVLMQQNFGTAANIMIYGIAVFMLLFTSEYDNFGIDKGFSLPEE